MTVVVDPKAQHVIAPELPSADRIAYVQNQLTNLKDLLDGAEDCKWIYVALIEYTMALWKLKSHVVPPEVLEDLRAWLTEIRKLDKLRSGRWDQLESLIESQT
jgi:geranylgeranyl transferase type-2 subunit alpha